MKCKEKDYTPEQIANVRADARRVCELVKDVPDEKRLIISTIAVAYMNGIEAGLMYAQDGKVVT